MKKFILIFLALVMAGSLIACNREAEPSAEATENTVVSEEPEETKNEETKPKPVEKKDLIYTTTTLNSQTQGIKIIGVRNLKSTEQINCDWSCSGIEFNINCNGGDIKFSVKTKGGAALFRVFLDGKEWVRPDKSVYYSVSYSGTITMSDVPEGEHTVRLVKVTGHTLARAHIVSVEYSGTISATAPANKAKYIEFVGDSIGCAWGTIGNNQGAYTDQDGTLAYTYMLAEAVGADYSMTALSGQGLLCGNPGMIKGYKYASPLRETKSEYTFERKADLVVINIGTNDDFQKNEAGITAASFKAAYKAFIQTVKEKNGADCKVLCLYNCMNDGFGTQIAEACAELGGSSAGIECIKLTRANGNQHPSAAEHKAYFTALKPTVENLLK